MPQTKLFGTSGIRGDANTFFTDEFCQKIALAFVKFLQDKPSNNKLAIGMDPRPSSQRIKENLIKILVNYCDVFDEGIVPTPAISYLAKTEGLAGAIMITGSHIQDYLNGLKFFVNGEEILTQSQKELEDIFYGLIKVDIKENPGKLISENRAKERYIEMLVGLAKNKFDNFTIVVDAGNGTQSEIMPHVLSQLGAKVIKINCEINKPLLSRDLEIDEAYGDLVGSMKLNKADLGILYDSDGDRSAFVTADCLVVPTDISGSLIAKFQSENSFVTPINSSAVVDKIGKKVIRTRVGSPPVVEAMKKNQVNFGFESSGGTISGEIHFSRDGGITTIKILNIMKKTGKSLKELWNEFPKYYTYKDKIGCPSELNEVILNQAKEKYKDKRIENLDGVKIWIDEDSWILFRPSGNAPEFRVFAESLSADRAKLLINEGLELVHETISKKS